MSNIEQSQDSGNVSLWRAIFHVRTLFTVLMFSIFAVMVGMAVGYEWPANFLPFVIGIPGMALCLLQVVLDMRDFYNSKGEIDPRTDFEKYMDEVTKQTGGHKLDFEIANETTEVLVEDKAGGTLTRAQRELALFGAFFSLLGIVLAFGFWIGTPIFLFLFLKFYSRESWKLSLSITAGFWLALYVILVVVLKQRIFAGLVTPYVMERFFG